jgi:hypothetical protein
MDDYEDDCYNPDECQHGVYYKEYCEDCEKADKVYEKVQEQKDFDYWHP